MYKCYQVLVQDMDDNVDENLAWLTQDWRSENVHAIELNCKVVKKVETPRPPPPLFRFIPNFWQKISHPPSGSIFGSPTPFPLLIRGRVPTMVRFDVLNTTFETFNCPSQGKAVLMTLTMKYWNFLWVSPYFNWLGDFSNFSCLNWSFFVRR